MFVVWDPTTMQLLLTEALLVGSLAQLNDDMDELQPPHNCSARIAPQRLQAAQER
jgi:hypothetical protein